MRRTPTLWSSDTKAFRSLFRGAVRATRGRFQAAHTGALHLENIVDLLPPLQSRIVEAVQNRTVQRMGGGRLEGADVWLLVTSCRHIQRTHIDPWFRSTILEVPPLRDRGDDVLLLADHDLHWVAKRFKLRPKTLSRRARAVLRAYDWPANVRELVNIIERAVVLSNGPLIARTDLPRDMM
jgi:DNA-binding NtrC family response regulator